MVIFVVRNESCYCYKAYYEECVYCEHSYRREIMIRDCGYWTGYCCPSCAKEFE